MDNSNTSPVSTTPPELVAKFAAPVVDYIGGALANISANFRKNLK
jgi:hypothetical protein